MLNFLKFVLIGWVLAACLCACSTERYYRRYQKQHPEAVAQTQAQASGAALLPDALPPEPLHPAYQALADYKQASGNKRRLPGLQPAEPAPPAAVPRKCKGCVFNVVAGNQTTSTTGKKGQSATGDSASLTSIEKAKAPVTTGPGDATDQAWAGVASRIEGNNNAPVLTNTAPKAKGIGATIADNLTGPLGWVLGLAALGGAGYLVLLWRRGKKVTNTLS